MEIGILGERGLKLEQLVAPVGLARVERDAGLEKLGIEHILIERDRTKPEAPPGIEQQLHVRGRGRPIDPNVAAVELRIQVAAVRGHREKRELGRLIGQVMKCVSWMEREVFDQFAKGGCLRSLTSQPNLNLADQHGRPGLDCVVRHPGPPTSFSDFTTVGR